MQSKKSVGLSISMIIVGIIALAVLFIIIAIFTNVTEKTAENIGSCSVKGGTCINDEPGDKCSDDNPIKILVSDCEGKGDVCCIPAN